MWQQEPAELLQSMLVADLCVGTSAGSRRCWSVLSNLHGEGSAPWKALKHNCSPCCCRLCGWLLDVTSPVDSNGTQ
jgi:hypothetical protein